MKFLNTYKLKFALPALLVGMLSFSSCEKMLEIRPEGVLLAEDALKTPEDMQKLLNSCYDALANQFNGSVQLFNDLLSDDIEKPYIDNLGFRTEIWNRNTNFFNSDVGGLYNRLYIPVYRVNSMELFYDKIPGLTAADINRIKAEGRFIRALCHFELVRLWARPYGYTSDNSHPGIPIRREASQEPLQRSSVAEVYQFILDDLDYAIANLPANNGKYADIRAAKALKAMVYFQMNDFANARTLLDDVINTGGFTLSDSIDRYHPTVAGMESEFVFSFVSTNANTDNRGGDFIGSYRDDLNAPSYGIRKELYDLIMSDTTDARRKLVKIFNQGQANEFYTCSKFNNDYFGSPYLTLTKLLLTRAEIAAETGDLTTASDDVNRIIARAYPGNANKLTSAGLGASNLLVIIREERRKELFAEGDRTNQMKRIGALGVNSQLPNTSVTIRNAPWNCPGLALQFPSTEVTSVFILNETGGCE